MGEQTGEQNFEDKIKMAEEILAKLDKDELNINESLKLHKQGKVLLDEARKILENAKLSIEQVDE
ncbi:exodeoxyribonuclease VII small subunit [Campylobacter sp. RM9344]|uniref:Exodeoxyribonuclease VII small subunit n=1 Tax=Campylobacter californiensis TaxID=1032243 RepID=A0AAW3ZWE9_9BACT|nr:MULTISPECIES: exodeoxyribonuclease VII small subunit [unclassified Campylobacter]MBE2985111.1 exodeoxyribonuclease VII small subunit [Campylobacter sp. RM6883]MBE2986400.1 exodeoxyribonuclease VII small subunit [Campylobacter sp. RM12919]MBE2988728.1 exodeoxyribonuclease VII small subunit [Campylobacter sp. RM12920]MBE2995702.1 exodeoxyribonuclease VII small subunit [Campylobacter sp. RM6913]MBE3022799.1 exodeoxyribonuclease VII small subunit [Campylobacter sp. 7477a]MBE3029986.1 exodeoxyr